MSDLTDPVTSHKVAVTKRSSTTKSGVSSHGAAPHSHGVTPAAKPEVTNKPAETPKEPSKGYAGPAAEPHSAWAAAAKGKGKGGAKQAAHNGEVPPVVSKKHEKIDATFPNAFGIPNSYSSHHHSGQHSHVKTTTGAPMAEISLAELKLLSTDKDEALHVEFLGALNDAFSATMSRDPFAKNHPQLELTEVSVIINNHTGHGEIPAQLIENMSDGQTRSVVSIRLNMEIARIVEHDGLVASHAEHHGHITKKLPQLLETRSFRQHDVEIVLDPQDVTDATNIDIAAIAKIAHQHYMGLPSDLYTKHMSQQRI